MDFELRLGPNTDPVSASRVAREAEERGFRTVWSSEAQTDPFLSLAPAAFATSRVEVGTAIAVAFGRSPYATAQAAWYLHRATGGRMILGLGTQVKAHIERRFGMPWYGAGKPLAEYIACVREIWRCWRDGDSPNFVGEHWQCTLMNPEFAGDPLPPGAGEIPVWIATVGPNLARVAGGVADGLNVHAFNTPEYLRDTLLPAMHEARRKNGRDSQPLRANCCVLAGVAHTPDQRAAIEAHYRSIISFYGSTPTYEPVLASVGFAELGPRLRELSRQKKWDEMATLVPDELLRAMTIIGDPVEVGTALRTRYDGLLTQVSLYRGGDRFMSGEDWTALLGAVR